MSVPETLLARRAARLSAGIPAPMHDGVISFDSGHAFPGVLPDVVEAARSALTTYRAETLQYCPRPGLPDLRRWIVEYMARDEMEVRLDEVMILNGAKQGIDLICRLLLEEGDPIVVTAPTYFTAIPIFRSFGATFVEISQDDEGLDVNELETVVTRLKNEGRKLPKFIYNVPDFHNPTGVTMGRARRQHLLDFAAANGIPIVEDSPYRTVRFEGKSESSLKALDRTNNVFYLGTFSKLMAPGLRIGWVAAPSEMIARMIQLKSDGGTCPLTQRIIVEFCKAGHLKTHIERVQQTYREHRDTMIAALHEELPQVTFRVPQGGYYLWLKWPSMVDGDELTRRVGEAGVIVLPGIKFFAGSGADAGYPRNESPPKNYMRLAYSHASPKEIEEGIGRLAHVYRSMTTARRASSF